MSLNVEVVKKSKVSPQGALNLPVALRLQTKRCDPLPPPKKDCHSRRPSCGAPLVGTGGWGAGYFPVYSMTYRLLDWRC
jgi:hypothetical protein